MRLNIGQKGFLIVALPLSFQFFFVAVFIATVMEDLKTIEQEEHAKSVLTCLNSIRRYTEEGVMSLARFKSSRDDKDMQAYENLVSKAPIEVAKLKSVVQKHADELRIAERIEYESKKAIAVLSECKANFAEQNQFIAFEDMPRLFKTGMRLKQYVDLLAEKYMVLDARATATQKLRAERLLSLLLLGIVVNVVITIILAKYYATNIAKRLMALAQNSERFAKGLELHPQLSGSDEIHDLDVSFRKMAADLLSAQQEQKELTAAALSSEERTRSVIENMPLGIIIIDQNNNVESLNPMAQQMFQWADDVRGQPLIELLPENPVQKSVKATNEIRRTNFPGRSTESSKDSTAKRKNGDTFPAEIAVSKYSTEEGKHFLLTVQDVTERHEMERFKREFVSMVSHDLRTPLTAVQGTLDLLDEDTYGEINATGHKRLKVAGESVDRLINLINDLLDIEKLEAGKMRIEQKRSPLDKILGHSVESVRMFAENAEVELEWNEQCNLYVNADSERIVQVVVNLLSNAVKFSPAGSTVKVSCCTSEHDMVKVSVIDQGRGIPREHLNSLFERFKQVKASDGARKKGTGLGLAICKAIVEGHGGKISVTSEEGKGSVFFFTIPLYSGTADN